VHKYSHWVPGRATHLIWFYLNEGFHMFQVKESRVRESNLGHQAEGHALSHSTSEYPFLLSCPGSTCLTQASGERP